jgi:heme/copper-type cytochrome/quinol oxidase subunit 2
MRGVIVVETQKEYNEWMIKQRPEYYKSKAYLNSISSDTTKTVALANQQSH